MNFESILYELLTESVEDVNKIYEKYYKTLPRSRFNSIAKADRFTKVDKNGEIEKLGKYARLLLTLYSKEGFNIEDLSLAKEYVDVIYKRSVVIPWEKIQTLPDIYPYVKKYLAQDTQSFKDVLQYLERGEDYKILHNGEEYVIYQPLTEKGACYLGVGAEWCTTWGPLSLNPRNRDRSNRFNSYSEQAPLYIIAEKTDLDKRVQFWFKPTDTSSSEFKNLSNGNVDPKGYFYKNELFHFFYHVKDDMTIDELKVLNNRRTFLPHDKEVYINKLYKQKIKEINGNDVRSLEVDSDFDEEVYMTQITDKNVESVIYWERDDEVRFNLRKLDGNAHQLDSYIATLENAKNRYPSETFGSDFSYDLEEMLEKFYEEEYETIISLIGEKIGKSWDTFKDKYLDAFTDKFNNKYIEKFDEINYSNVDSVYDKQIEYVTENVKVKHDTTICFDVDKYNDFIRDNEDIDIIDDFDDFLTKFLDFCDVDIEDYDFETDFGWDYPYYSQFAADIINWFTEPFTHEMRETREKLSKILNKYFYNNSYRDNDKEIKINDDKIDYDKQSVEVDYYDRQKNQKYTGYVLIDNLPKYVTMNMLAEQQIPNDSKPQVSITVLDWDFGDVDDSFIYIVNLEIKIHTHNKNITYILHLGGNIREDDEYRDDEDIEMLDPMADWEVLDNGNYFIPGNQSVRREISGKMAEEVITDLSLYDRIERIFMNIYEQDREPR
jgi:hypothetical protein